jgi:hypothetical protein
MPLLSVFYLGDHIKIRVILLQVNTVYALKQFIYIQTSIPLPESYCMPPVPLSYSAPCNCFSERSVVFP